MLLTYLRGVFITTQVSAEEIYLCPPAFSVGLSDLFGEHHNDEEDEESLEGHHDGVDVGQRDQLLYFHYQHSKYPCYSHDDDKKKC